MQCCLAKIVQERCYGEAMIAGRLFLNRLSYFKKGEQGARHDSDEGSIVIQANIIKEFKMNNRPFKSIKRFTKQPYHLGDIHVLCLFAGHTKNFPSQRLIGELGDYALLIRDHEKFFTKIGEACERRGYNTCGRYVRYYRKDRDSVGTERQDGKDAVFYKPEAFRYQQEYRIAVDTGTTGCDPLIIDIGEIGDIAEIVETDGIEQYFLASGCPVISVSEEASKQETLWGMYRTCGEQGPARGPAGGRCELAGPYRADRNDRGRMG